GRARLAGAGQPRVRPPGGAGPARRRRAAAGGGRQRVPATALPALRRRRPQARGGVLRWLGAAAGGGPGLRHGRGGPDAAGARVLAAGDERAAVRAPRRRARDPGGAGDPGAEPGRRPGRRAPGRAARRRAAVAGGRPALTAAADLACRPPWRGWRVTAGGTRLGGGGAVRPAGARP